MEKGRKNDLLIEQFIEKGNNKTKKAFSEQTSRGYLIDLEQFRFWLDEKYKASFENLEEQWIVEYLENLKEQNLSTATVDRKYSSIQVFLNFLGKKELMDAVNRPEKSVLEGKIKLLTSKELKKVLKRLEKREIKKDGTMKTTGLCYIALVNVMVYCYLRGSEVIQLKKENLVINGETGFLIVENKKTGIKRKVYIPNYVMEKIQTYLHRLKEENKESEWLFIGRTKKPIDSRGLHFMLSVLGKECNIEGLNASSFRNAFLLSSSKESPLCKNTQKIEEKFVFKKNMYKEKISV